MVCVCPPHTSISLYCRPGSHSPAIFAARARALSAERNSSTKRILPPLLDLGSLEGFQFVRVGLAYPLQELQRGRGLSLVNLGQREAHVDEHPLARLGRVVVEQADVDHAPDPTDVHPGQVGLIREELDHLTWDTKAHAITSSSPAGLLSPVSARPSGLAVHGPAQSRAGRWRAGRW